MTLQEIFKSVQFVDMVKYLIDIESQVFENLYCFDNIGESVPL